MPRAHRLPALRICLLIAGVVLLSASVLAASADPFGVLAPYHSHSTTSSRASKRRAKCAAAARGRKHRKAHKACAVKKPKTSGTKRSVARRRPSSSPSVASPGTQPPVAGGVPPTEALEVPGSEPGSSPESPVDPSPPVEPTPPVEPPPPVEPAAPFRFFSPTSFWNEPVPAGAPLDPSSAELVGALATQMAEEEKAKSGPWINVGAYGVPIYTVPADQPTVRITLARAPAVPALQSAWSAVPLPSNAKPATGTDGHLVVWQPSTDRLWEFWRLEDTADGWQASWGGAMQNVSSNPGVYGPEAWSGAEPDWGASASSLSIAGGLIMLEDLHLGQINHALAIAVPNVRGGVYATPARRTDGTSIDPLSLPEGAHLRLDPKLDLAALHLPPLTLMMAEAAQRYGLYIRDGGAIGGFFGQRPAPTEANPYTGPGGYFEGKYPNQILASFPWSHLQVLKMELHGTS